MLESPHPPEVKEQALCIVGNIASGAGATDYVMNDDRILHKLLHFMVNIFGFEDSPLRWGGVILIGLLKCIRISYIDGFGTETTGGRHVRYTKSDREERQQHNGAPQQAQRFGYR